MVFGWKGMKWTNGGGGGGEGREGKEGGNKEDKSIFLLIFVSILIWGLNEIFFPEVCGQC